jgi:hypothetical protein
LLFFYQQTEQLQNKKVIFAKKNKQIEFYEQLNPTKLIGYELVARNDKRA